MIVKNGVPYFINDYMEDVTGESTVTFADIVASDIILEVILCKDKRNKIKQIPDMPTINEMAMNGLDLIVSDKETISVRNYEMVSDMYRDLTTHLSMEGRVNSTTAYSVEFVTSEAVVSSFTMVKCEIEGNTSGPQVHYLLPLFSENEILSRNSPIILHIDGEGNLELKLVPIITTNGNTVIDIRRMATEILEASGYSFCLMNNIPHTKLLAVPVESFSIQYLKALRNGTPRMYEEGWYFKKKRNKVYRESIDGTMNRPEGDIVPFVPNDGFGVYLNDKLQTIYGNIQDTEVALDNLTPDLINNNSGFFLLMYDNRLYLDKLMEGQNITVSVLSSSEIDYAGFYMDKEFIEPSDQRAIYAEANTATKAGRAVEKMKTVPKQVIKKAEELASKVRTTIVNFRKADDDKLKEKIINDEFIPILDNSLKWILGGITTYGLYFFGIANPLIAVLGGLGVKQIKQIRDKERREKALRLIKDELEVIDEKINDAKARDDRAEKYALMRIKQNLERKLIGVTSRKRYVN